MKKIIIIIISLLFTITAQAGTKVFEAGISIENIPKMLYGNWRISATQQNTNAPKTFKAKGMDFWTLTRINDSLTLSNPNTGAKSTVSIKSVEGNLICFTKIAVYDENKKLTDTVTIRLDNNTFSGINHLKLETFSLIDNHLIKTEYATYQIFGEKISGENVLDIK